MKFALIALLALSTQAFSAEYLVKYVRGGGFAPVAMNLEVSVLENGKVVAVNTRGTVASKTIVATLSPAGLQNLKDQIEQLADNTKLIDQNPSHPGCMDAPSSSTVVNKGGKIIKVAARINCKNFKADGSNAQELAQFADSLVFIAR